MNFEPDVCHMRESSDGWVSFGGLLIEKFRCHVNSLFYSFGQHGEKERFQIFSLPVITKRGMEGQ